MSKSKQQQPAEQKSPSHAQDDPYAPSLGRIFKSFGVALGITAALLLAAKYVGGCNF